MQTLAYTSDGYLLVMAVWLVSGFAALWGCLALRRRWREQPRRQRLVRAALSAWFFLAAATVPEVLFALFYNRTDAFNLTNTSQRWYAVHVQANEAGYRDDRPFAPLPPEGRRRIVFAGDSFTFGHGVADTRDRFSDRIAARLEQARPGEFAVSNCALPGMDLRRFFDEILAEWTGSGTQVDVLVYTFVLNDIETYEERTGEFYQSIEQLKPNFFLFRDTYFYNWLYCRVGLFGRPQVRGYYSYLAESYQSEPWNRLAWKVERLASVCKQHNIHLRIAVFPFLHNLGPAYPFGEAHRRLMELFEKNGIRAIDLEPELRPFVDEGLIVNRFDPHPNERAHEIAAGAMEARLLDDLFRSTDTIEPGPAN
jgi:hypothetical protein